MICKKCGKVINDDVAFCGFCGSPVNSGELSMGDMYMPENSFDEETMPMMPPISEMPSTEFCLKCGRVLRSGQICPCSGPEEPHGHEYTKTEKTRIDAEPPRYTPAPLSPTYHASKPAYEKPVSAPVDVAPPPRKSAPASTDGKSFFKSVNKL